jgi:hypothetical protein
MNANDPYYSFHNGSVNRYGDGADCKSVALLGLSGFDSLYFH